MRNRNIVATLLLVAIVATVCVWTWPSQAESRDAQRRGHRERRRWQDSSEREQIRQIEMLSRVREMHEVQSEMFGGAPIAGLMAINTIKEIATRTGKLDLGIEAMEKIAEDSPVPGLRRAALMSLHELQLADKDPGSAIESLVRICVEIDEDEEEDDDDDGDDDDD